MTEATSNPPLPTSIPTAFRAFTTTGRLLQLQAIPEHPGVFRDEKSGTHYRFDSIHANDGGAAIAPPDWLEAAVKEKYGRMLRFETVEFTYVAFDENGRLDTTVHGNEQHWASYYRIRLGEEILLAGVRLSSMVTAFLTRYLRPTCIVPLDARAEDDQVCGFSGWRVAVTGSFPIRIDVTPPTVSTGSIYTIHSTEVDWPASLGLANDRLEAALARELARAREDRYERIRGWIEAAELNETRIHLDALSQAR